MPCHGYLLRPRPLGLLRGFLGLDAVQSRVLKRDPGPALFLDLRKTYTGWSFVFSTSLCSDSSIAGARGPSAGATGGCQCHTAGTLEWCATCSKDPTVRPRGDVSFRSERPPFAGFPDKGTISA